MWVNRWVIHTITALIYPLVDGSDKYQQLNNEQRNAHLLCGDRFCADVCSKLQWKKRASPGCT
jgi:hypothetical protein